MKEDIYTHEFFLPHLNWRHAYVGMAQFIRQSGCRHVVDYGCGNGLLIDAFAFDCEMGVGSVLGFEGSELALQSTPERIRDRVWFGHDITASLESTLDRLEEDLSMKAHCAVCIEVAEHLPEHKADHLVDLLAMSASRMVFFSGATPGQGGSDHINEQPHEYWIQKFKERGWVVDETATEKVRVVNRGLGAPSWYINNTIIFIPEEMA